MSVPKILVLDGYNLIHRARSGFTAGDHAITYNFFKGLRALVEQHKPTRVYFVLEGVPKKRNAIYPAYKANRERPSEGSSKSDAYKSFLRQKKLIIDLLMSRFPLAVIVHPDFECDDVVYNLVCDSVKSIDWTIVSSDSDFTQIINEFPHVSLYNPIARTYVQKTHYDYVVWKSLRGDPSDNIDGITGIGDKTAYNLVNDQAALTEFLRDDVKRAKFELNKELISFERWTEDQAMLMESSRATRDWESVKGLFDEWAFKSITKEPTWTKFVETFDRLFM